ncbi:MAG: peptidyl-prolyl cis-trans isomerase [Planctomycetota bacterium]|nr:peptidyl-prolyl cis-trans isomerase [Planctomycetota bacterium]MDA1139684.1 peptidyl-prolyl cis-trans isomerase [Planctomycetota bacterium]
MPEEKGFNYPEIPTKTVTRKLFDKRTTFFTVLITVMFVALVILQLVVKSAGPAKEMERQGGPSPASIRWTPEHQRKYAQTLVAKGLKKEAALAFADYLREADLPLSERANTLYTMGLQYFEIGEYESALSAFYQAEVAGVSGDIKAELDLKVVTCLEKVGKSFDAQSELEQRTSLVKKEDSAARGVVVARIGNEEINLGQLFDELQKMSQMNPQLAQSYRSDKSRLVEFLRQHIFQRLLARKAKKLGIDRQPEFRKQMEDIMDQSLAQVMVQQEVQSKVSVDPADIRNYFEANRQKYVEKGKATVSHILVPDEAKANAILKELEAGKGFAELAREYSLDATTKEKGGLLEKPITEGADFVPGIGKAADFVQAAFTIPAGETGKTPIKSDKGFHLIKIHELTTSRPLSYQEAQQRVAYDYQNQKAQMVISKMLQETLEVERVQIYDQVLMGEAAEEKQE